MNALVGLENFLRWLLDHSLQAAALVLFVLIVQRLFRRHLTHRWRFALWWIVIARLVLPFGPESAFSVFNYFRPPVVLPAPAISRANPEPVRLPADEPSRGQNLVLVPTPYKVTSHSSANTIYQMVDQASAVKTLQLPPASPTGYSLASVLGFVWLGGVLTLSLGVLIQLLRFQFKLRHARTPADSAAMELLNRCRRESGVNLRLGLLETNSVRSPALFGLFRPRLLLPTGLLQKFTPAELRYIFLHELSHVKRGDLWVNWLVTALQILHWFNPLIWFGFARLRADRELACDELTLLCAGEKVGTSYGETVIKLLEGLSRPAAIPGLVGILEDTRQMRRRIRMIASFRRPNRWSALALILLAVLAVATLTDAQSQKPVGGSGMDNWTVDGTHELNQQWFWYRADSNSPAASSLARNSLVTLTDHNSTVVIDPNSRGMDNWRVVAQATPGDLEPRQPRPDLKGAVRTKQGSPLLASVFIATAAPKVGTSTFCPSCYADCRKHVKADGQGRFTIESLDPQLTFQVLAVAKGYKPKYISKVDPATGPITIELDPIESSDASPDRSLRGRIVDIKGQPIEGAVVEMEGVHRDAGGGGWGAIPGVDPVAVTDDRGEFLLSAKEPFEAMDVKVSARAFANRNFTRVVSRTSRPDLTLFEGASLTGRVLFNGKPLKGVSIGISAVDRTAGNYLGNFEIGTDADGVFTFVNLPPDVDFCIYGIMNTLRQFGVIATKPIHTAKDGETTKAGDLAVSPGYRLAGRIVLDDNQSIPDNTRLLIGREDAWDVLQLTLGKDGSFETPGIPPEAVSLSTRIKGYHVSSRNGSFDPLNMEIVGRVNRDTTNLVILMEKGPDPERNYSPTIGPESEWPRNRPLAGAENAADHSRDWAISGRLLDSETKQPIQTFLLIPGQDQSFGRIAFDPTRLIKGSNGAYFTFVSKRIAKPVLKVEADGYLPDVISVPPRDTTNLDFALKKGSGPGGRVVLPGGGAVSNASLALICNGAQPIQLSAKGVLMDYTSRGKSPRTDAAGKFAFKPEFGMSAVAAASEEGYAMASLDSLATNSVLVLEPYGRVTGKLTRASRPGTNEILDVAFVEAEDSMMPRVSLQQHVTTDAEGRFSFDRVPPGNLKITRREYTDESRMGWQNETLREFSLKPGQSLELNVEGGNQPPRGFGRFRPPPAPVPVAGVEIKGIVLTPSGTPAADAEVALQVEGTYLALGRASFISGARDGTRVRSKTDGSFALPMFERATKVVVVHDEGFAQVTLDTLKTSSSVTLQKWGQIEGTLQVNGRPAKGESLILGAASTLQPLNFDHNSFQAKTDENGHFVITMVPPGNHTLSRLVPTTGNSLLHRKMGSVDVKPGETTQVNLNSAGRVVTGKIKLEGTNAIPNSLPAQATLHTLSPVLDRLMEIKSTEARGAFVATEEFRLAIKNQQLYQTTLQPDGSFRIDDAPPGKYAFTVSLLPRADVERRSHTAVAFKSEKEIVIPEPTTSDSSPFDVGVIPLKRFEVIVEDSQAKAN